MIAVSHPAIHIRRDGLSVAAVQRRLERGRNIALDSYVPASLRRAKEAYDATIASGAHVPLSLAKRLIDEQR